LLGTYWVGNMQYWHEVGARSLLSVSFEPSYGEKAIYAVMHFQKRNCIDRFSVVVIGILLFPFRGMLGTVVHRLHIG
jgi:hypothetical protein